MSEPRTGRFKLAVIAVEAPIAIYLSLLSSTTVIAEMLVYYLVLYGLISLRESSGSTRD